MRTVIGALVGLIAAVAYAFAATELLRGGTGIDLIGALTAYLPDDVTAWLARSPIASAEDAPSWRTLVMGIAVGAGLVGALFLLIGQRIAAMLLWLAFLLFFGVLGGQDLVLADGFATADGPELISVAATLALAFAFATLANAATAQPEEALDPDQRSEPFREPRRIEPKDEEPPPRRRRAPPPEPESEPEPPPRRRAPVLEPALEPEPEPTQLEPAPAPEPEPTTERVEDDDDLVHALNDIDDRERESESDEQDEDERAPLKR